MSEDIDLAGKLSSQAAQRMPEYENTLFLLLIFSEGVQKGYPSWNCNIVLKWPPNNTGDFWSLRTVFIYIL